MSEYYASDKGQEECVHWFNSNHLEVDLRKVKSLAQLKAILRATENTFLFVEKGSVAHRKFWKVLKPID